MQRVGLFRVPKISGTLLWFILCLNWSIHSHCDELGLFKFAHYASFRDASFQAFKREPSPEWLAVIEEGHGKWGHQIRHPGECAFLPRSSCSFESFNLPLVVDHLLSLFSSSQSITWFSFLLYPTLYLPSFFSPFITLPFPFLYSSPLSSSLPFPPHFLFLLSLSLSPPPPPPL